MLKVCDSSSLATGTIAGGAVHEPHDQRIAALWRHDGAIQGVDRALRVSLIREASNAMVRGDLA